MKVLFLGVRPDVLPAGCKATQDPAEADVVVCSPACVEMCPPELPVYIVKEGTMKDFLARQKRPDAVLVTREELENALATEQTEEERLEPPKNSLVLASYANKGGVGKSTVVLSLAFALAAKGIRVVLCDLDFGAPDLAGFFDRKPEYGIEKLGRVPLEKMILKVRPNIHLLPGAVEMGEPDGKELLRAIGELRRAYDVVLLDTPPAPWEKPVLHPVFPGCDLIYAVVDQSKFSMQETAKYAPTLLAMGVNSQKIRLVVNRYNPKLTSVKEIQKAFVSGFRKDVKYFPKVSAIVPEGWEEHVKNLAKGQVKAGDEWEGAVKEILSRLDVKETGDEKGRKRWKFSLF